MAESVDNSLSNWFLAALTTFVAVGTADWALAIWSSTGVGVVGAITGWMVFVAIWVLGATIWTLTGAAGLWAATGRPSTVELTQKMVAIGRRWWSERHSDADAHRLATFVAAGAAGVAFLATSVGLTTYLIETRNLAWLIATTTLIGQLVVGAALVVVGLSLRRLLLVPLRHLRRSQRLGWLNTPTTLAATMIAGVVAAIALLTAYADVYMAVEGPAFTLVALGILLHPLVAHLQSRLFALPTVAGRLLIAVPLIAIILIGTVSQHADARRLVVLHGASAQFGFHHIHRHADLDRLFDRSDCPPLGADGLPTDGISFEAFDDQCMDPAFDRPVARTEIPAFERPDLDKTPAFVFVTWDSVRVDRLGFMGHSRDTTPNLDAFAQRSLSFDRAFAQDSGTGPSFWSLMAGKTPFQVSLVDGHSFPPPIDADEPMLGTLLTEAGYQNEAVLCGTMFERPNWRIRDGFERFENVCGDERTHLAPRVTEQGIETLERLADDDRPFFLWVHYFDPHHPYTNHGERGYGTSRLDRYDEELAYTDKHFQPLLDAIDDAQTQTERPIYTIFSADHGENFGEHGSDPHARNLYRNVTQVPKLVHGPHITPRRIDDAPVALNDVYPSVLDLAGIDIPADTTMHSQVPVYFGAEPDTERMVFQENSYSRPRRHTRAVVFDRYHYIMDLTTNSDEFYDYVDDPLQRNNLIGTGLVEEQILRQALARFLQTSTIAEGLED